MTENTDDFPHDEINPYSANGSTHPHRIHNLFDRVTRLEVQRESDTARVAAFESEMRGKLGGIEAKLDILLDAATQRKGLEKFTSVIWDILKLTLAAVAGALAANWHH